MLTLRPLCFLAQGADWDEPFSAISVEVSKEPFHLLFLFCSILWPFHQNITICWHGFFPNPQTLSSFEWYYETRRRCTQSWWIWCYSGTTGFWLTSGIKLHWWTEDHVLHASAFYLRIVRLWANHKRKIFMGSIAQSFLIWHICISSLLIPFGDCLLPGDGVDSINLRKLKKFFQWIETRTLTITDQMKN